VGAASAGLSDSLLVAVRQRPTFSVGRTDRQTQGVLVSKHALLYNGDNKPDDELFCKTAWLAWGKLVGCLGGICSQRSMVKPMSIQFQWDAQKAARNQRKHRISFAEAATVFRDPLASVFDDKDHSEEEYREIIIGHSIRHQLLVVSFTERGDVIRIISARKANREEREDYESAKR